MRAAKGMIGGALIALMTLGACGERDDTRLKVMRSSSGGPDEFAILPPKPLEMPTDLTALPDPDLGGVNRTDPNPMDDAIAALGGRPGTGTSDGALVGATTRYGVSSTVRTDLAAEDLELRRRNRPRLLERWFGTDVYSRAYSRQSVNQHSELERWRASGRRTPAAPPDPAYFRQNNR